jgi:S1-C subfamily serine protease
MDNQEPKTLSRTNLVIGSSLFIVGMLFFPSITVALTLFLVFLNATKRSPAEPVANRQVESAPQIETTSPGETNNSVVAPTSPAEPKIGGFLYLVGFWMLISPFVLLSASYDYFKELPNPILETLSLAPIHKGYIALWPGPMFIVLIIFHVAGAYAFLRKSKLFPKIFIRLQFVNLALIFASTIFVYSIGETFSNSDVSEIIRSVFFSIFWSIVLIRSTRVKQTFVNVDASTKFIFSKRTVSSAVAIIMTLPLLLLFEGKIRFGDRFARQVDTNSVADKKSHQDTPATKIAQIALDNLVVVTAYDSKKRKIGMGSGFYFLQEDFLVTNYHVISDASYILFRKANADEDDEESYDSVRDVVAVDRDIDLVVFRTKRKNSSFLSYGKSTELKIGEKVYVAGNPRGFEGTFSDGLLSNRFKSDGITNLQITAPISSGSSGGPLLNANGDVVGIVTASIKKGQNLNIAIPSYYIFKIISEVKGDIESTKSNNFTFEIVKKGSGKMAVAGDTVTVHYVGMLPNKKLFDSSTKRGEPFTFKLGAGQVIEGWDKGIQGMRVNEIRTLDIPADLAYGQKGVGDVIPPNSPLIFHIRLLEIHSADDRVGH